MFKSKAMALVFTLLFLTSLSFAQYDRDAVIEILYPDNETVVDTDFVEIDFYLAPFFTIGDSGCTDCDGYIKAYLNDDFYGNIVAGGLYAIDGLVDGDNFLELVVVDPTGLSFTPSLHDTVTFVADYTDDYCPATNLYVSSEYVYEALFVKWNSPSGGSGYFEDFENSDGDYIAVGDWDYGSSTVEPDSAHSGAFLWGINIGSDYVAGTNAMLDSPPINLPGIAPQLSFWQWYDTEFSWDGGNVKLSIDGGTNWEIIHPTRGYDDDAASTANAGIPGEPCFSGHDQGFWEEVFFDLTAYAGEEVIFRWHFGSDGSVQYPGWFIDDVSVGEPDVRITGRTEVEGCGDLIRFDLFRDDVLVAGLDTTFYLDTLVTNGVEYCYYVKAVYDTNGVEINSVPTDTVCSIPDVFQPPPPTYLSAAAGDEEVTLNWAPPGTVIAEGDNCLNPYIISGGIFGGDSIVVTGTTTGFENDFMNGFSAGSPDVVYYFTLYEPVNISFSLCGGSTWDTYLMLINDYCDEILAYDDDGCPTGLQSLLTGTLDPGIYGIVVDGYGTTNSGDYTLTIEATATTRAVGFAASVSLPKEADLEAVKASSAREIANSSVVANSEYLPNTTMDLEFGVIYSSSDVEYLDGMSLTFPADFVVNFATDAGGLIYNGETGAGATVTFGDFADDGFGELSSDAIFFVNVTIGDISGTQTLNWALSGDLYGSDPHDVSGTLEVMENIPADGDFLGYNIYVDNVQDNTSIINSLRYTALDLTNGVTYDFDVKSMYYPDWESAPVSVSATPTWLFGDLMGVITDPAGNLLDSAVVKVGGLTDTTGVDGVYLIYGIVPGSKTATVSRPGFDGSTADVTIITQDAAIVQDFMLLPKLGKPNSLMAKGGDHFVDLAWNTPGGLEEYELFYDDGTWESSITGGATDIEISVKFNPGSAGILTGGRFVFSSAAQAGYTLDPVEIRIYTVGADGMPGTLLYTAPSFTDVTAEDIWIDVDLSDAGVTFDDTGFFLGYRYTTVDGPGTGRDLDGYIYGHSFVLVGGAWSESGDLGFPGNLMVRALAGLEDAPLETVLLTSVADDRNAVATLVENSSAGGFQVTGEETINHLLTSNREDALIGYNVYQLVASGDSLVHAISGVDTFATIDVPDNYIEYCFNVKAIWDTDDYDTLESKVSNTACAETFMFGDVDFNNDVTITDLTMLVDFVLDAAMPTLEQFRGADINRDDHLNIQDIILMVDIIVGAPTARIADYGSDGEALLSLIVSDNKYLNIELAYDGLVRGIQFTINNVASELSLGQALIKGDNPQVIVNSNANSDSKTTYLVVRIDGQPLDLNSTLLSIPYS
ncbi:MAG: immune inhibitor A, partial [Candidatus Marinimicrobia bacterium]|nr:immune inhibitor A [Candidatus Neomarinimicrobiota bacterium]